MALLHIINIITRNREIWGDSGLTGVAGKWIKQKRFIRFVFLLSFFLLRVCNKNTGEYNFLLCYCCLLREYVHSKVFARFNIANEKNTAEKYSMTCELVWVCLCVRNKMKQNLALNSNGFSIWYLNTREGGGWDGVFVCAYGNQLSNFLIIIAKVIRKTFLYTVNAVSVFRYSTHGSWVLPKTPD